ncbi:ATPase [Aureococcus anophagefferens]|nr:ATPase [Aureococcus anophagefferens]
MESKSSARLAWDIKRYDVLTPKKERKRVLHAMSHAVYGGELFLILGPSGSGKTSLVTILAGRNAAGSWSGALLAEGAPAGRGPRRSTGFVDQQPSSSARHGARVADLHGRLRLPTVGAKGVRATVARVLNDLDLGRCGDTYVGDERLKGISGGEKKRLQIAAELVSDPNTLVLDEPTSGLDAATALLTSVAALDLRKRDRTRVLDAYGASRGAADAARRYGAAAAAAAEKRGEPAPSSWLYQFDVLARRAFTYKFRDEMVVVTQVSMALIMAVLLGAIYYDLGLGQESVQNRRRRVLLHAAHVLHRLRRRLALPEGADLYKREHAAGLYCPSAFFHARCVAELPGHLVAGGCYATVTYWMMGFQQDLGKFLSYVALCEALVLSGTSLLIACGCLAKDFEGANNIATVAYCLFMMFDGHYINNKSIPEGARWIKQLNFFNWGISAAARSELKGLGEMHGCRDPASQKCVFQRGDDAADYYGYHQTVREALAALALICASCDSSASSPSSTSSRTILYSRRSPSPTTCRRAGAGAGGAGAEDGPGTRGAGGAAAGRASCGATPGGFVHAGEAETRPPTSSSAASADRASPSFIDAPSK